MGFAVHTDVGFVDSGRCCCHREWYYKGTDLKYQVTLSATGFSQVTDEYDLDFYCGGSHKHFDQDDLVHNIQGQYFLLIPTSDVNTGSMRLVITLHVPDEDFQSGTRDEVTVTELGMLVEPMR